jgi:replicative DNA helicase
MNIGPPSDIDAEKAVLGSVLVNRDAMVVVAPLLQPGHFYLERHAQIYAAMLACYNRRIPPDTRMVADELRAAGHLDGVGGTIGLMELSDGIPTSYHAEYYAAIVSRLALFRAGIHAGGRIAAMGHEATDAEQFIADAYSVLDAATARPADDQGAAIGQIIEERYMAIQDALASGEAIQLGQSTGLRDLDEQLAGGLHKSDLFVLAARPGVGKSSLALTIALHVAGSAVELSDRRVEIFSLEMSRQQNLDRLIAMHTGLDLVSVRTLALNEERLAVYMAAMGALAALPIHIEDAPALTLHDMRARVLRRAASLGHPALVIVDYLGLMSVPKAKDRYHEVSEIARGLKNLAKELDVPILALSQLSRAVEGRQSHVPMLSDLRESGEIEQAADVVCFIYREEMYDRDTADKKGIADLHIAKHRHGPIGVVPCRFDANTTRFQDLSYKTMEGY